MGENGEDIGGQLADLDFLADHGLPEEYFGHRDLWTMIEMGDRSLSDSQITRKFMANLTHRDLLLIADWMIDNGHGNGKFREKAEYIVGDYDRMTSSEDDWGDKEYFNVDQIPENQVRCLIGFVRSDIREYLSANNRI